MYMYLIFFFVKILMKRDVVKVVFNDIVCKYRFMCEIKIYIRGY